MGRLDFPSSPPPFTGHIHAPSIFSDCFLSLPCHGSFSPLIPFSSLTASFTLFLLPSLIPNSLLIFPAPLSFSLSLILLLHVLYLSSSSPPLFLLTPSHSSLRLFTVHPSPLLVTGLLLLNACRLGVVTAWSHKAEPS